MNTRSHFANRIYLWSILLVLALTSCQRAPFAFSPEAAAQQEVLNHPMPEFNVDPNTVQVLQMADLGESKVALISFQGNRQNSGRETCLFSYNVYRAPTGGWQTGGGGGGCGPQPAGQPVDPISIGSGMNSGGPGGIGYSEVSGEVFDSKIATVQVTWNDGAQQQVSVINHSYLAVRPGEFNYSKVEALDAEQNLLFSIEVDVAPGKW